MLPPALFHLVVTFILMNLLAAALRFDPAAVFGPSAFYLLVRIQFRLRGIIEPVVHVFLMVPVVAFLLVYILPSSRHVHHATIPPKLALHQFIGITTVIVIGDWCRCKIIADVVHTMDPVLINAILLMNAASPRHRSYPASCCKVRAIYQISVIVSKIRRHVFFLQVRSKLASEIIISISINERTQFMQDWRIEDYKLMTTTRTKPLPRLVKHSQVLWYLYPAS